MPKYGIQLSAISHQPGIQIKALPKSEQAEVCEMGHRLEDDAIPQSFWQGLTTSGTGA